MPKKRSQTLQKYLESKPESSFELSDEDVAYIVAYVIEKIKNEVRS